MLTLCGAAPAHYYLMHATDAVRAEVAGMRAWVSTGGSAVPPQGWAATRRRLAAEDDKPDCGTPPGEGDRRDPMYFTQSGCSVNSMDGYAYIDSNGVFRNASKGELIQVSW